MAYMDQEKKAGIAAALKKVMPADWKYSLSVRDHSTIVMVITKAPVDLVAMANEQRRQRAEERGDTFYPVKGQFDLNPHWFDKDAWGDAGPVMEKALAALNLNNHDRSDSQSDYFDVGHYVELSVGRWNKPFEFTGGAA